MKCLPLVDKCENENVICCLFFFNLLYELIKQSFVFKAYFKMASESAWQLRSSGTVVVECSGKGEAQVRLYLEATASQQTKTLLRFNSDSGRRWRSK